MCALLFLLLLYSVSTFIRSMVIYQTDDDRVRIIIISDNVHNETNCSLGQYVGIRRKIVETLVYFYDN